MYISTIEIISNVNLRKCNYTHLFYHCIMCSSCAYFGSAHYSLVALGDSRGTATDHVSLGPEECTQFLHAAGVHLAQCSLHSTPPSGLQAKEDSSWIILRDSQEEPPPFGWCWRVLLLRHHTRNNLPQALSAPSLGEGGCPRPLPCLDRSTQHQNWHCGLAHPCWQGWSIKH